MTAVLPQRTKDGLLCAVPTGGNGISATNSTDEDDDADINVLDIRSDGSGSNSESKSKSKLQVVAKEDQGQKQLEKDLDAMDESTTMVPTVAPSNSSPVLFSDKEDDDKYSEGSLRLSSIIRQQSRGEKREEGVPAKLQTNREQSEKGRVVALEERVRDLEEKLSILSMLLSQPHRTISNHYRQQQQMPKNDSITMIRSPLPSSSARSVSPSSPFRSLTSYSNMPSSTAPVLESPIPIATRYQRNDDLKSNHICNCHEFDELPVRHNNKSRQNLSFQILHAPNDTLDLSGGNADDASGYINDDPKLVDAMMRIPSLDSLPGSARTSPVLLSSSFADARLSPDSSLSKTDKESSCDNDNSGHTSINLTALSPPPNDSKCNIIERDDAKTKVKDVVTTVDKISENSCSITSSNISSSDIPKNKKKKCNIESKWLDYLNSVQESNYDTDKQMEEFVRVPSAVEALLTFGFWISVDSFLYTLTVLPMRCVWSLLLLLRLVLTKIMNGLLGGSKVGDNEGSPGPFQFHRRHSYQLIQVSIIYIIYEYVLKPINISIIYHWIRVQSMVKLYLVVAIVEVFDRLMCSLGQDCLDSLYWNTTRRPRSSRLIVSALVVLTYVALHSFLLFVHLATLNVAMNSNDQALLSLLIGGNFAEIKSTVFKKYNKASLFKITAADVCERFKLALFLFLVLMLNASQGMDKKMLYSYLSMCGIVWCAEWLADWLKHSFITKFNFIASGVYSEYGLLLAGDVSGFGHEGDNLDHSHAVVKRLGLAQIPLVCVMAKYLKEAYKYATYENQPQTWMIVLGTFAAWLSLFLIKLSLESFLHRLSRRKLEAAYGTR
mmetsp:Transcript_6507/g.7382  ORF Transcript_6507/g.7382 Transcript_6507/m.7382 type:complete len:835 (+) Transcript_6507:3-2507(+)